MWSFLTFLSHSPLLDNVGKSHKFESVKPLDPSLNVELVLEELAGEPERLLHARSTFLHWELWRN